ncbi:MAG: ATP-binding protein [Clostridia bacterium]|nr:ATP-binding protein [Clostridia bacterium]
MKKLTELLRLYDVEGTLLERFAQAVDDKTYRPTQTLGELLRFADAHAVQGNCWHYYVAYFIASDVNAFSLAFERKKPYNRNKELEGTLMEFGKEECKTLMQIFNYNLSSLPFVSEKASLLTNFKSSNKVSTKPYADIIAKFTSWLESSNNSFEFLSAIVNFYSVYGVGELGLNKAFRVIPSNELPQKRITHHVSQLLPIANLNKKRLEDIVGYEMQKKKVVENTKAFLDGKPANNVFLYGDMGTGKSSTVKALINEFYEQGLRIIEIYKHQFLYISDIISRLAERNYKFILYLDDLSFDDSEVEYKYFKAIIDGGLEVKPDNVLIYATSNRRHIIKENYSDGNDINALDELHKSDTKNEKLSLAARFGLSVYYPSPDQQDFLNIVHELAKRYSLDMDIEKLDKLALTWAIRNGIKSGRMAEQFVFSLAKK